MPLWTTSLLLLLFLVLPLCVQEHMHMCVHVCGGQDNLRCCQKLSALFWEAEYLIWPEAARVLQGSTYFCLLNPVLRNAHQDAWLFGKGSRDCAQVSLAASNIICPFFSITRHFFSHKKGRKICERNYLPIYLSRAGNNMALQLRHWGSHYFPQTCFHLSSSFGKDNYSVAELKYKFSNVWTCLVECLAQNKPLCLAATVMK